MSTTLTSKGQVTIPKRIRDELQLVPGARVEFSVNAAGEVVLHRPRPAKGAGRPTQDRFDTVRGSAGFSGDGWRLRGGVTSMHYGDLEGGRRVGTQRKTGYGELDADLRLGVDLGDATVLSLAIGMMSGYLGKKFDLLLQRFVDTTMSIPQIILMIPQSMI